MDSDIDNVLKISELCQISYIMSNTIIKGVDAKRDPSWVPDHTASGRVPASPAVRGIGAHRALELAGGLADSLPGNGRSRVIAKILLTVLFLVSLLSVGGLPGTAVLCLGSDGHVAIEARGTAGCRSVEPATALSESLYEERTASRTSHCGPCIDVFLFGAFKDYTPLSSTPESQAPAALPTHSTALSPKHLVYQTLDRTHERPFLSIKPYTIVLRC